MKLEIAQILVNVAEKLDIEVELREEYSGRGMMGKTTTAIVCSDMRELYPVFVKAGSLLQETEQLISLEELLSDCQSFRTDNMGKGIVVY